MSEERFTLLATLLAALFAILVGMIFGNPARAHEPYIDWKIPGTSVSCCSNMDCEPTRARGSNPRHRCRATAAPDRPPPRPRRRRSSRPACARGSRDCA